MQKIILSKSAFTIDEVKLARKKFAMEKTLGKTQQIKINELESLLLYGIPKTEDRIWR